VGTTRGALRGRLEREQLQASRPFGETKAARNGTGTFSSFLHWQEGAKPWWKLAAVRLCCFGLGLRRSTRNGMRGGVGTGARGLLDRTGKRLGCSGRRGDDATTREFSEPCEIPATTPKHAVAEKTRRLAGRRRGAFFFFR